MEPKPITENLPYKFREKFNSILHALLSFCFLLSFVLALYYGNLTINGIYNLALLIALVSTIKLIRKIILFLIIQYIEGLIVQQKFQMWLKISHFYLKSNPLLYFMNSQAKLDATVKRFLNSKLGCPKRANLAYDLLLSVFYYPLTRFLYCLFLLARAIFSDRIIESISKRLEGYIILLLCSLPFIVDGLIWYHFLYFYIFLLFLLFPIVNLIGYLILSICISLIAILKLLNGVSYVNKLLSFMIKNGVNFDLPTYSLCIAYPTVFTLTLMRNDISLLSKLSGLYCNIG